LAADERYLRHSAHQFPRAAADRPETVPFLNRRIVVVAESFMSRRSLSEVVWNRLIFRR
jgi:hypothetical protein